MPAKTHVDTLNFAVDDFWKYSYKREIAHNEQFLLLPQHFQLHLIIQLICGGFSYILAKTVPKTFAADTLYVGKEVKNRHVISSKGYIFVYLYSVLCRFQHFLVISQHFLGKLHYRFIYPNTSESVLMLTL